MNDLTRMNLIAIIQQLPKEDIEFVQTYINTLEEKNQELRIQVSAREEVANKYKDIIDKVVNFTKEEFGCGDDNKGMFYYLYPEEYYKLLEILKEVK